MGPVGTKVFADLRHRRLQTAVVSIVLFLASAAATLALAILVESTAPFEQAFARANGAHLVVDYSPTVDAAELAATGRATSVTASAGPWPVADGLLGHLKGEMFAPGTFSGRPQPDSSIDTMTISAGRWWQSPGEAVLEDYTAKLLNRHVGETVAFYAMHSGKGPEPGTQGPGLVGGGPGPAPDAPVLTLTVVGIAGSVSTPDVAGWMSPADIAALSPDVAPSQQMLYRVSPSASTTDLAVAMVSITHGLPSDAVVNSQTYLSIKAGVDKLADLYVPILLAFSIFALLAAAFTISNMVSGIVLTSYRDIGVMKAIGYTPSQVTTVLIAEIMVAVVIGALAGVAVGTVASQPILQETSLSFGLPAAGSVSLAVIGAVLVISLLTAVLAVIGPATHAGRLSAVGAMTRGLAPSGRQDGGRLRRLGLRLPFAPPVRLGVASGVAHPVRATMTLGALLVGVAAATFAIGMNSSLWRVMADLNRNEASPVRVELADSSTPAAEVTSAIADDPDTGSFVSIGQEDVTVSPIGDVPFVGYDHDSSWIGYALIHGRWFEASGEAVAPTNFFTENGLHVGDAITVVHKGRSVSLQLVGEIFDDAGENDENLVIRGTWSDLAMLEPSAEPMSWEVMPTGIDAHAYSVRLGEALGRTVHAYVEGDSADDAEFLLFLTVIGLMGVVLVAISLGGVFNTVLLETRQRTREIAVLKAIGLTPAQTVGMVLVSIVPVGIAAGLLGVPLGLVAQRAVLSWMGMVAAKTGIPPSIFDVFPPPMFLMLGAAGLAIGLVGAYLPAQRAARARIAPTLQAE